MTLKKRNLVAPILFSSVLFLSACGDDEQVTEPVNNENQEQPTDAGGTGNASPEGGLDQDSIGGKTFGFTEIDVNVDYPDMDDMIEIKYEEDRDKVEAEYQNEMTKEDLSGNDAMDKIEPGLSQLELTTETADDEVITKVIEAFAIDNGFTEIEVEVRYPDGTDKEYRQTGN